VFFKPREVLFNKGAASFPIGLELERDDPKTKHLGEPGLRVKVNQHRGQLAFLEEKISKFFAKFEALGIFGQSRIVQLQSARPNTFVNMFPDGGRRQRIEHAAPRAVGQHLLGPIVNVITELLNVVSFEHSTHEQICVKLFALGEVVFVRESTGELRKKRSMVFASYRVHVLEFVTRTLPNIAGDVPAIEGVEISDNIINTGLGFFAIVRAASTTMRVDSNELAVDQKLSEKFAVAIFARRLASANERRTSNGTITNVGVGIESKHNLGSLRHLFSHLEGPREEIDITFRVVRMGVRGNVQDHKQNVVERGFIS